MDRVEEHHQMSEAGTRVFTKTPMHIHIHTNVYVCPQRTQELGTHMQSLFQTFQPVSLLRLSPKGTFSCSTHCN